MHYDNIDRIEQLEYIQKAELLILAGYTLKFDETVEQLAKLVYVKYQEERNRRTEICQR